MVEVKRVALGVLKSVVEVFAWAAGAVAIFLLFYQVHDFGPYLPRMQAIYATMDPEDRQPPGNVQRSVEAAKKELLTLYGEGK